jgi:H+-transporting ATPase
MDTQKSSEDDAKTLNDSNGSAPKGAKANVAKPNGSKPSVDELRRRAYEIFLAREDLQKAEASLYADSSKADAAEPDPSKPDTSKVTDVKPTPDVNEIRDRAYKAFQSRHGEPGSALEDWKKAESSLSAEAINANKPEDDAHKPETAKADAPKADTSEAATPNADGAKTDAPNANVTKPEAAKADESTADSSEPEVSKTDALKADGAKAHPSKGAVKTPTDTGTIQEALTKFKSSINDGLTQEEAAARLKKDGPNAIEEKRISPLKRFLTFLWGPIPWMIEIAAVLSAAVRHWEDFVIIFFMLALNAVVGFWEEFKADNEIEALKKNLALHSRVLRDGKWSDVEAKTLVSGDIVMVKLGNVIPADLKLVDGDYLSIDQSALTGESLPVDKKKNDVAYSGSIVRMGQMNGLVVATGMDTLFGRTARLVETVQTVSHFQKAVLKIGNFLILITLGLVALILACALYRGDPLVETLLFALILTVAAIPVALPAVLSVTMAVGATVLARMKAIVSRLVAIEEMAGMDILCSDKTGTLTKNELKLGSPVIFKASNEQDLILGAALASRTEGGDGIDEAVLKGLSDHSALKSYQIAHFTPFDPVSKRTEAEVKHESVTFKVSKGAPQVILDLVHPDAEARKKAEQQVNDLAAKGYRTLGVARTNAQGKWEFLGLLSLSDPPRDDSASTIATARKMGLQVRMVTGDNLAIAREVSSELKLGPNIAIAGDLFPDGKAEDNSRIDAADGYAQVFPEHKFKIVKALQAGGHIVGMTGDGVNDAPALKQADCGIAVSGATDAARAASDLVLTATGLSVITAAIREARKIFERMNSYAIYRISETIRVLLFMTLAIVVFNFYPVTAVMIVLIAVLNDFPIMMIAYDNTIVAPRPVRWDMERVLTVSSVLGVMGVISAFALFWIAEKYLQLPRPIVQSLMFLKLLVAGHLTIYITRSAGTFWSRPWPNWRLVVATETTQVIGTLAAVYGWGMTPLGWKYALAVWVYALAWFFINDMVKVEVHRMLNLGTQRHQRHLARVNASFHPAAIAKAATPS